ncbi:MAG: DUF2975 domain-containing protein [Ruminococcus sp.]|nr:DUF2975 domain-containing protein [Ruminococcus sp.]MCM1381509.1 DUF2975 domain-containing protein [Muribaculaceae bacterium]MCM1480867.1 DUF2975 domain-containing protein [Muribaculaceae bacterium]
MKKQINEKETELNMNFMTNALYLIMFVFMILYAAFFVLTVIHTVQGVSAYEYLTDGGKADFWDHYLCRLADTLTMAAISAVGFDIFRRFKKAGTPFTPDVGRGLRIIAVLLFAGWILMFAAHIIAEKITGTVPPNEYSGFINGTAMMFVSIFIMLGYIFDYGCKLQRESDETL